MFTTLGWYTAPSDTLALVIHVLASSQLCDTLALVTLSCRPDSSLVTAASGTLAVVTQSCLHNSSLVSCYQRHARYGNVIVSSQLFAGIQLPATGVLTSELATQVGEEGAFREAVPGKGCCMATSACELRWSTPLPVPSGRRFDGTPGGKHRGRQHLGPAISGSMQ